MKKRSFAMCQVATVLLVLFSSCYQPTQYIPPTIDLGLASVSTISTFLNVSKYKIAFTKKIDGIRAVHYFDFSTSPVLPIRLKKPAGRESTDADSPLLSPDGLYVTYFCITGNTERGAYVQYLDDDAPAVVVDAAGTEPHWWQDSTGRLFIVYSNKFQNDDLTTTSGKTYRRLVTFSGTTPVVGAAEEIAPYPMNGGLSKDGRYLCTGYYPAAFYNRQDSLLISINTGLQVCNPSITPDQTLTDRMMFLNIQGIQNMSGTYSSDPAYPKNSTGAIEQHKVIFITDKTNTVIDFLPVPSTYQQWQDPEWSNKPGFATALGLGSSSSAIADALIINLTTKAVLNITPGDYKFDNTSTPSLWIGN